MVIETFLTLDIESKYDTGFRNTMRKLGIMNRDKDSIGYIRGKTTRKVGFTDAQGKYQYTDEFVLSVGEYTSSQMSTTMNQIQSQVSDVVGYNVWFDMDLTTRLLGTDWGNKTVWDVMQAADVAGLTNRARMQGYARSAGMEAPRGVPLKDRAWSAVNQLGIGTRAEQGVAGTHALDLVTRLMHNPYDSPAADQLHKYLQADVEDTRNLFRFITHYDASTVW